MTDLKYVRLDGDNIGDKIELSLLDNDFKKAQQIQNVIQYGIKELVRVIRLKKSANLLMVGCDDIFFSINKDEFDLAFLSELQNTFFSQTNSTLSVGVGDSPLNAINGLRRSKLAGKNRITEL